MAILVIIDFPYFVVLARFGQFWKKSFLVVSSILTYFDHFGHFGHSVYFIYFGNFGNSANFGNPAHIDDCPLFF